MKNTPSKTQDLCTAKQAFEAARDSFNELLSQHAAGNVGLEEIEQSEDGKWWLITLGYDQQRKLSGIQAALADAATRTERHYKTFKVEASTGRVVAMKIREVA